MHRRSAVWGVCSVYCIENSFGLKINTDIRLGGLFAYLLLNIDMFVHFPKYANGSGEFGT